MITSIKFKRDRAASLHASPRNERKPVMNRHVSLEPRLHQPSPRDWERPAPSLRVVSTDELFRGRTEIAIDHYGVLYRLRVTRQGKLILNK